jgi:hypothetical protein
MVAAQESWYFIVGPEHGMKTRQNRKVAVEWIEIYFQYLSANITIRIALQTAMGKGKIVDVDDEKVSVSPDIPGG